MTTSPGKASLTLREAGRVVIDIGDHNGDGGGAREASQLARHVCGLDHYLVALLALAVKVGHGRPDHACGLVEVKPQIAPPMRWRLITETPPRAEAGLGQVQEGSAVDATEATVQMRAGGQHTRRGTLTHTLTQMTHTHTCSDRCALSSVSGTDQSQARTSSLVSVK